ncbi:MAG: hypothetical protein D6760_11115 [Deltaproteobacteria bacterium]|nr:MAG: hypothetical protein D6760_11115 [Deltaproteobacteria bacterium]
MALIKRVLRELKWPVSTSAAFDVGDLLWYDSTNGTLDKLSNFTWDTDETTTRRNAMSRFVGISQSAFDGSQIATPADIAVPSYCLATMTITSATPKIGDLVGFEKASGNNLEDQKLQVVTDIADAIGYVVKRYTSATTKADVVLISNFDTEGGLQSRMKRETLFVGSTTTAGDLVTNWTFGRRVKLLKAHAIVTSAYTGTDVLTFKNGASTLQSGASDITLSVTGSVGAVVSATLAGADSSLDIFEHDDQFDVVSDGASTSGSAAVIIEYMPWPDVA